MNASTDLLSNRIRAIYPLGGFAFNRPSQNFPTGDTNQESLKHEIFATFKLFSKRLLRLISNGQGLCSALKFVPSLCDMPTFNREQLKLVFNTDEQLNNVLMDNDLIKIVLIQWPPNRYGKIHGHPKGGCILKVLSGKIEEKRYTPSNEPILLSTSTFHEKSMAYIDDDMAYHAVGNPFNESAYSIHVYVK